MLFRILLLGSLFIIGFKVQAQTENELVNEYIERYIENTTDEVDIQQFASDLLYYFKHPFNINKADATELFQAPFLTEFQALEIIQHRKKFGDFISIYELQVLNSFTVQEIKDVSLFIRVSSLDVSFNPKDIWQKGEHQLMTLVETTTPKNKGFKIRDTISDNSDINYYQGSPLYTNLRYRFDYERHLGFGLNAEKDAGEEFFKNSNSNGYDYYSFYFSMNDVGKIKTLNLGDFQANFGQGLTLSTGLAFGKSSIVTNAKRNFNGFGAYRSLRENAYLRGGALALSLNKLDIGLFASIKKIDGNAVFENDSADTEPDYLSSIQEDGGLHRTQSELLDKRIQNDFQTGFFVEYKSKLGKIGSISYLRKMEFPLIKSNNPYNAFNFSGNEYQKTGIYYDFVLKNFNLFGESSISSFNTSFAHVHGALFSLSRNVDLSMVYRNYSKSFITLQTNGFGENSSASNEEGIYSGFQITVHKHVKLLGYYDLFKSPWLKFNADAPSRGNDFWAELNYKPNKQFNAYYRYRTETKQSNFGENNVSQLQNNTLIRHRINTQFKIAKGIELRNRVEWNRNISESSSTFGSLIYQDIIYKPFGKNFHLSGRIAYSKIESFANRIYSFEQVPLYDYPMHTHSYNGLRYYLASRIKVSPRLDIWLRYASSVHEAPINSLEDNYCIGSGLAEIVGTAKNTYTFQLRYSIP
ncbi:MAG: hypothetical protein HKP14_05425 [Bacteroidia bacterium]|nr:hypothetical protein [Bacteroidia bacterium]